MQKNHTNPRCDKKYDRESMKCLAVLLRQEYKLSEFKMIKKVLYLKLGSLKTTDLTVDMLTKNEEKNICKFVESCPL